jgi:hypothetical protein
MRRLLTAIFALIVISAAGAWLYQHPRAQTPAVKPYDATVPERSLWRKATNSPLPDYPFGEDPSVGVVVAQVFVTSEGRVESSGILQAPSARLGAEVEKAVRGWTFQRTLDGETPLRVRGKLTFYFERTKDGQHVVRGPWRD